MQRTRAERWAVLLVKFPRPSAAEAASLRNRDRFRLSSGTPWLARARRDKEVLVAQAALGLGAQAAHSAFARGSHLLASCEPRATAMPVRDNNKPNTKQGSKPRPAACALVPIHSSSDPPGRGTRWRGPGGLGCLWRGCCSSDLGSRLRAGGCTGTGAWLRQPLGPGLTPALKGSARGPGPRDWDACRGLRLSLGRGRRRGFGRRFRPKTSGTFLAAAVHG